MALQKYVPTIDSPSANMKPLRFSCKAKETSQVAVPEGSRMEAADVDIDLREVYFLIMHFLSAGPCQRTYEQFWNELLQHQLLPRRYHAWFSRTGAHSGDENDNGSSFPLSYNNLVERYPHIEKDHLVKLLKKLILGAAAPLGPVNGNALNAAAVPTLLGTGSFSLLGNDNTRKNDTWPPGYMHWPHTQANQLRGLSLREIGGGFSRHHRGPSIRAACYAIAKPSTMVQKMQDIKKVRGHRNAVYCAIFDRSGRYVITGSDDRLVKIWSMETAYCLASCRGHEGDITDLAVNFNNTLVASASNDCIIRVWRLPDGLPISVLRGHTGAVTAIAFSPRLTSPYQLLSSSDDGTCRIWDARHSQFSPRIYVPRPPDPSSTVGKNGAPSSSTTQHNHQIFCCAFNSNGTVFVTGSSDTFARVWNACKPNTDDSEQPNHEMDILAGHENDVNYVQFSGCAVTSRLSTSDYSKEDNIPKFRNSWFTHDNIVTCSRDGSAIIWTLRSRRSHGKAGRWTRAYHLKVPPPPLPPQPPRGGPRQRILPTPRGVNMIVWSLDNRFVLAAIMDCRICVWNAVDGGLVHSLTGHTESTYVLDVHPFNPRIAMSAGYDGKTIVWDIWEGIPIRVYEMGRWKLVDGKFSSDGTSIILSDDVGQLYILNTGQGESQKDAKYDQFFLGDYRPLVQDTHGNVLDQETQLAPYRRNMQDLLCDSAMIPYPEPYQSMYQRRRLGALGIEWRPSSVRFAVGAEISLDQEYHQMLPIVDLDMLIDPLPELLLDAMDWEPENERQSDDNDSEYNVPENNSSRGDQGSLSSHSSDNQESSEEDSDEAKDDDSLRRSKRKKQKTEAEIMTSSGRRVKRKNFDEFDDDNSYINNRRSRKSRSGHRGSRKKSSSSKSLRPKRAAALNARNFLSRFTGGKVTEDGEDEEEGSVGDDSSESESVPLDSNIESEEYDDFTQNDRSVQSKGKERCMDDEYDEKVVIHKSPEYHMCSGSRKRLVLRLPNRNPNRLVGLENMVQGCVSGPEVAGSSSSAPQEVQDVGCHKVESSEKEQPSKFKQHFDLLGGFGTGKIRWGGVRSRTSKRSRTGEPLPLDSHAASRSRLDVDTKIENVTDPNCEYEESCTIAAPSEAPPQEESEIVLSNLHHLESSIPNESSPSKMKITSAGENSQNGDIEHKLNSEGPDCDGTKRLSSECGAHDGVPEDAKKTDSISGSVLQDLTKLRPHDRMFNAVYKRSKSSRARSNNNLEGSNSGGVEASTSNAGKPVLDEGTEEAPNIIRKPRSTRVASTSTTRDLDVVDSTVNLMEEAHDGPDDTSTSAERDSINESDELPDDDLHGTNSRVPVRLRSTRTKRTSYRFCETQTTSPPSIKKSSHESAGSSWLMLIMHEEGSRYIPQMGDEVAYLRQGHQEYITSDGSSKEKAPWRLFKGNIRAVEFCKVEDLEYVYSGSGESCRLTLQFVDPTSSVVGKSFKLTLPSEASNLPDFLVERSRYDAAMKRSWTCRDKCRVWWKNEVGEGGDWWEGRILSVKPKSSEFPDSPWERYEVRYKSEPHEKHGHSPWELYDDSGDTQWERPHIDDDVRDKMLRAFVKLENPRNKAKDDYGVQKLKEVSQKAAFVNRFPVPLSLELIQSRLENNYYRSLEAMKHDFAVMVANAESYFGRNAEFSAKMRRLADWFIQRLSSM